MNIKLTLQYDGTAYHGWQIQPDCLTIQGIIESALSRLTDEKINVIGCGRTDAGVHALEYICNFNTTSKIPAEKFAPALNTILPLDIVCKESCAVSDDFHSKKSLKSKTYLYVIDNSPIRDAFGYKYSYQVKPRLDFDKMQLGARYFVGTHDFIGFASTGFSVKTTVRTIYNCELTRHAGRIHLKITGNGFLYNMVRIIAGTLIDVGLGKTDVNDLDSIISSKDRTRAGKTAPPQGLYLYSTNYEEK